MHQTVNSGYLWRIKYQEIFISSVFILKKFFNLVMHY